jgi:hypothetical protein
MVQKSSHLRRSRTGCYNKKVQDQEADDEMARVEEEMKEDDKMTGEPL